MSKSKKKAALESSADKMRKALSEFQQRYELPDEVIERFIETAQDSEMYVTRGLLNILRIYKPIIAMRCPKDISPSELKTLTQQLRKELDPDDKYLIAVIPSRTDAFRISVTSILSNKAEDVTQLINNIYDIDKEG